MENIEQGSQKLDEAIDAIVNFAVRNPSPPPEENMFAAFGKSIAVQLKNIDPVRASTAMAEIQQIITKHTISEMQNKYSQRIEIISDEYLSDGENVSFSPEMSSSFQSLTNEFINI